MRIEIREKVTITEENLQEKLNLLPNSLKRKTPPVFQAAYFAAKEVIEKNEKPQAIICVSALGCLNETISFLDKLDETNFGSPKDFVYSVHNSLGGMLAKEFEIFGPNLTIMAKSFDEAQIIAEMLDEKTFLFVFFDDGNEFARNFLLKCNKKPSNSLGYASACFYSK